MTILDILRHNGEHPVLVRPTETVLSTVRLMNERGVSAVIVEDDHLRPAAIFTERDFARAVAKFGAPALSLPVGPLSNAPLITCRAEDRIEAALAVMTRAKIRHLPVMQDGQLVAVVNIGDLARQRLRDKELEAEVLLELSRRHG
jgi:CBS domain-containing protein